MVETSVWGHFLGMVASDPSRSGSGILSVQLPLHMQTSFGKGTGDEVHLTSTGDLIQEQLSI